MQFLLPYHNSKSVQVTAVTKAYRHLVMPYAVASQMSGDFGSIVSQQIKGTDFSIWKHDFFIDRPVLLHPYVTDGIHTLNYVLSGQIRCELVGLGKLELNENTYNLYYIPPVKQYAWPAEGQFSCLHIDLSPEYLQELAVENDPLKEFLKFSIVGKAKIVRSTHYPMDGNVKLILKDIIQSKETGAARNIYFRSRIYNLLLIFSRDLAKEEHQVSPVDADVLKQVQQYLLENYHLPITIDELCRRFGICKTSLKQKFKAQFNITVHQFLTQKRMQVSVELLDKKIPVSKVATSVGYPDTPSFTKVFNAYYHSTPTDYINRWKNE